MSDNTKLIEAIKDAENAIARAINELKSIADDNANKTNDGLVAPDQMETIAKNLDQAGVPVTSLFGAVRVLLREVISLRKRMDAMESRIDKLVWQLNVFANTGKHVQ